MSSQNGLVRVLAITVSKPGKFDELSTLCQESVEHYRPDPRCKKWMCNRALHHITGEELDSFIITQEWTSLKELLEQSGEEWAVKTRERLLELTDVFDVKMMQFTCGFEK